MNKTQLRTRDNKEIWLIKRYGKHEMYKAAANITRHTVLQQTVLLISRNTPK